MSEPGRSVWIGILAAKILASACNSEAQVESDILVSAGWPVEANRKLIARSSMMVVWKDCRSTVRFFVRNFVISRAMELVFKPHLFITVDERAASHKSRMEKNPRQQQTPK